MKDMICLFAALSCLLLYCGCVSDDARAKETKISNLTTTSTTSAVSEPSLPVTVPGITVEVYHFHGESQCASCTTVGAYAENTVNRYYLRELASGRLLFGHVNYDLPENKVLAEKYGVTGSSLWIGTYVNGKFNKEEDLKVWYRLDNETEYSTYLRSVLDKRLAGDLS
jgi:hypothetical protein